MRVNNSKIGFNRISPEIFPEYYLFKDSLLFPVETPHSLKWSALNKLDS